MDARKQDPYRLHAEAADAPICANCIHKAEPLHSEFGPGSWLCRAHVLRTIPSTTDHITGVTTGAMLEYRYCRQINGDGTCTKFERVAVRLPSKPLHASSKSTTNGLLRGLCNIAGSLLFIGGIVCFVTLALMIIRGLVDQ